MTHTNQCPVAGFFTGVNS